MHEVYRQVAGTFKGVFTTCLCQKIKAAGENTTTINFQVSTAGMSLLLNLIKL